MGRLYFDGHRFVVDLFRNKVVSRQSLNGVITFGKAFQVGILIALVASVFYVVGWEIYFNAFAPDFMDEYAKFYLAKAKASEASSIAIQHMTDEMSRAKEMYKHPFLRFGMTFSEIFPVGLLITLISAAVLQKKEILPA